MPAGKAYFRPAGTRRAISRQVRRLPLLLLAAAFAGCASVRSWFSKPEGESVEAEGWSPMDAQDLLGTKKRSLLEAQKKAVEKVLGVYISAKTRVAQAAHVDQNILAKVDGYVRRYDVLWERQEDGFYKTRIRAFVLYQKVGQDLKSLGLTRSEPPPGNPRVAVLVQTRGPWSEAREGRASGAVARAFMDKGFSVVDRNDPLAFGSKKSTDPASAAEVARDLGSDLVVRGQAEVHELTDVRLAGFFSYRARVELEAVRPPSGAVAARTAQEASGLDPAPEIAAAKALENAGMLAGQAMASELSRALKAKVDVALRVDGAGDLGQVQQLAEDVRLLPEVSAVTLSEYRKEGSSLAVTTEDMPGDQLAAALLRMKKYHFAVQAVSSYSVEVALQH